MERNITTPGIHLWSSGIAVTRDGSTVLVSGDAHAIHKFNVADGVPSPSAIGELGAGALQFNQPHQVWIASDGFVFVADFSNNRVQVLKPDLSFDGFVGVDHLRNPAGVCADAHVVVVSEFNHHGLVVFNRSSGARLRTLGSQGSDDGQLLHPRGLCLMSGGHFVAVADSNNHRVSVFSVEGPFSHHVGDTGNVLKFPVDVACSPFDELVVADWGHKQVLLFSATRALTPVRFDGSSPYTAVAIHGSRVFAHFGETCVVFA